MWGGRFAGRSVGPAADPQNGTSEGPAAASPPARNTPSRQAGRLIPTTCVRAAGTANAARRGRQPFLPSRARGRHFPQAPRDSNSPVLLDETGSAADVFARHRCSRTHQDLNLAIRQYSKQPETEPSTKVAKPGVALTSPKSFSRLPTVHSCLDLAFSRERLRILNSRTEIAIGRVHSGFLENRKGAVYRIAWKSCRDTCGLTPVTFADYVCASWRGSTHDQHGRKSRAIAFARLSSALNTSTKRSKR